MRHHIEAAPVAVDTDRVAFLPAGVDLRSVHQPLCRRLAAPCAARGKPADGEVRLFDRHAADEC
eukprot:7386514-Prymnesium_polylepis.1